jgi:muconolactone D-isomerase
MIADAIPGALIRAAGGKGMEYLVHIEVRYPPDGDQEELRRMMVQERLRAAELVAEGRIVRLWRIPGRRANWGIWEAPDATALHAAIGSLPSWRWIDVEVHALARHPSDPLNPGGF